MAQNERQLGVWKFAIHNMQIGAGTPRMRGL